MSVTKLREAAEAALEALEWFNRYGTEEHGPSLRSVEAFLRNALVEHTQCDYCSNFFSKYRCSLDTHGECDCPKCQGLCECIKQGRD